MVDSLPYKLPIAILLTLIVNEPLFFLLELGRLKIQLYECFSLGYLELAHQAHLMPQLNVRHDKSRLNRR